jgi:hypothetical protein
LLALINYFTATICGQESGSYLAVQLPDRVAEAALLTLTAESGIRLMTLSNWTLSATMMPIGDTSLQFAIG